MTCQFECPFCQTAIQAETVCTESAVECPACGQSFIVESPPEPVRVQARAVPAPPRQQMLPAHPSPPKAAQHAHPPHHPPRRNSVQREEARARAMFLTLLLGGPLLIAGLIWAAVSLKDAAKEKKLADWREEEQRQPGGVDPFERALAATEEDRRLEKEAAKKLETAIKAGQVVEKQTRDNEARERQRAMALLLASEVFEGNMTVAEEAARELEAVMEELDQLRHDGNPDNDPRDPRDWFEKSFTGRLMKNRTVMNWAGGRSVDGFARRFFGGGMLRGPDGKPVDPKSDLGRIMTEFSGSGSGFWISRDGWLLSNDHVVRGATVVQLRLGEGKFLSARVVKTDREKDLALLKAEHAPPVWLTVTSHTAPVGRAVAAAGFPRPTLQGLGCKLTLGTINSLSGIMDNQDQMQCEVTVFQGNSGGPLVDLETGLVVGVISMQIRRPTEETSEGHVSYAIKSSVAHQFVSSVAEAKAALDPAASFKRGKGPGPDITKQLTPQAAVLIVIKK